MPRIANLNETHLLRIGMQAICLGVDRQHVQSGNLREQSGELFRCLNHECKVNSVNAFTQGCKPILRGKIAWIASVIHSDMFAIP
jgi:hypothetical protein